MQKLILLVFLTFLLGFGHAIGWGFVEEELKGLEEDQIMFRMTRHVRNVETETGNEGSGEEPSNKSRVRRRREVQNKEDSSSLEEDAEGSGESEPTVKQTESPTHVEAESNKPMRLKRIAVHEENETLDGSGEESD